LATISKTGVPSRCNSCRPHNLVGISLVSFWHRRVRRLRLRDRDLVERQPNVLDTVKTKYPRDEIVSPDDPERDLRVKRADYAEAGIPEHWIVNPADET